MASNKNKPVILFLAGGSLYYLMECIWKSFRGGTLHWSMFLLGGISFLLIGAINEHFSWELGLVWQALIGAAAITGLEFIFGLVLNVWLGRGIWDYSHLPLNVMGQICLPFSLLWCVLAVLAIFLDDFIRWRFYGEEKPVYCVL